MPKIDCFKQNYCISGMLKVFPCNFLLNSGESLVTVTSFTLIHRGLLEILLFQKFQLLENAQNA